MACNVYDLIREGKFSSGLSIELTKIIIYQTLTAMDVLNRQYKMIHTDIKPENILILGIGNKIARVIDIFRKANFDDRFQKRKRSLAKNKKNMSKQNINQIAAKAVMLDILNTCKDDFDDINIDDDVTSSSPCDHDDQDDYDDDSDYYDDYDNSSDDLNRIDDYSEKVTDDFLAIDEKYLTKENICIKLSDFGRCCDIKYDFFDIQTRHYRSPEIILNHKFNSTCDIWSVGCVLYEMLTGELLFNPSKSRRFNRDRQHLYDMQTMLGPIPQHIIDGSLKKRIFFKHNGLMKGASSIEYIPFEKELLYRIKKNNRFVSDDEIGLVIDLINKMLEYDPVKRPTAGECLRHKWFLNF